MPNDKLSAKEAALLAQVRAEMGKEPAAREDTEAIVPLAFAGQPAPAADPAARAAALLAAARAETGHLRRRQRRLYVWVPVAFLSVVVLCTLLWMWHRL